MADTRGGRRSHPRLPRPPYSRTQTLRAPRRQLRACWHELVIYGPASNAARTWSAFSQFSGHVGGLRLILCSVTEWISAKAVVVSLVHQGVLRDAFAEVSHFRSELYACLTARGDALFELCDALLCTDEPVRTLVDLALAPEHRRGYGALYGGLNQGRIDVARLRRALARVPLPRAADGRLVLAVDVSPWLRPDANTCADRAFCHTFGRGEGKHQMVPGWPYSVVAALETGRTSWTAVLDAVRLEPGADVAAVTTVQIREVVERLVAAGQWRRVTRRSWSCWTPDTTLHASPTCWPGCPSRFSAGSVQTG
jgi:DDE superfamily endonuclease